MNFVSAMVEKDLEEIKRGVVDKSAKKRKLSVIIFIIGAVVGMALMGISVYADFEATLFDITIVAEGTIRPIACPVFLSKEETGHVSATFKNATDELDEMLIRAHISRGHLILMREEETPLQLAPGEQQRVSWEIFPEDAAYNHLIMVKVIVLGSLSDPTHKGSCGVVVLDLPWHMRGWQLFWMLFIIAMVCMLTGIVTWWRYGRSYTGRRMEATRAILGLGTLILVGLVSAALGFWELSAGCFYVGVLLIGVIVPHFLISRYPLEG